MQIWYKKDIEFVSLVYLYVHSPNLLEEMWMVLRIIVLLNLEIWALRAVFYR